MKGTIIKRSKGAYTLVFDLGPDPATGKRRQKWIKVNGTKKAAEQELAKHLNDLNQGGFVSPAKLTVGEFLDKWLTTYAEPNVGGKTLERYRSIITLHLKPSFGALPLPRLLPLNIQEHYAAAMRDGARKDGRPGGLSAQSVLHHHRVLSEALKMAVKWQLIARNPADAVEPPKVRPAEAAVIDESQTAWLIASSEGTRLYLPILLAVCTGLRRGEILAVRWCDLNAAAGTLRIARSVEETKAGIRFKEPKGKRSRTVALPPLLLEALEGHREEQAELKAGLSTDYQDGDLICCQPDGALWKPSAFTSSYRDLLRRRKLTGPNFHALRHSHASHLLKAGVDIKQVSGRLGHARAGFTLNTYAHLLPGQDQEAARRTDVALRKAIAENREQASRKARAALIADEPPGVM